MGGALGQEAASPYATSSPPFFMSFLHSHLPLPLSNGLCLWVHCSAFQAPISWALGPWLSVFPRTWVPLGSLSYAVTAVSSVAMPHLCQSLCLCVSLCSLLFLASPSLVSRVLGHIQLLLVPLYWVSA